MNLTNFTVYTNLLVAYVREQDQDTKAKYKYQLMLLDQGFKPCWSDRND